MKANLIIDKFRQNPFVSISEEKLQSGSSLKLKGIAGSSDVLAFLALHPKSKGPSIAILHDREEADLFISDLSSFLDDESFSLFPSSYKKPYQYDEIENANVLQRSETLNSVGKNNSHIVVTYPEALCEKVINKRTLVDNTHAISIGDKLDADFLTELFIDFEFEKTEFVYEPGQFAIRGGIIDIFSFASEQPYRVELWGDEVETIRTFEPESQLSKDQIDSINIIPDTQTRMLHEERQSLLSFIPDKSVIWIKDFRETVDIINRGFDLAQNSFDTILEHSGQTKVISSPDLLFESGDSFRSELESFRSVEFGKRYVLDGAEVAFDIKPQPSFNKNFEMLADTIRQLRHDDFEVFICSDSANQIERLTSIFEEIDPSISFQGINAGLREGFIDESSKIACFTDHQIFERVHRAKGKKQFSKKKALTLKELKSLQTGDYVVHIDHGVARFAGLDKIKVGENTQEALRLVYRDDDLLYVSIHALHKISKYSGKEGIPPATNKLGSPEWENKKKKVKRKVKNIAKELIALYAKRKAAPGFAYPADNFLQAELESSFMYEDTPDQSSATADFKADMEQAHPMDRLVCGDVGFGKTEVAIRAAFKAVNSGKQVAVLVPTTILAMQHYQTFSKRLENFPISIDFVNRFKPAKDLTRCKKEVKEGKIDILIGTHRIVNKDIEFKDLGLMIIDEEQKFGVKVKERLKEMRVNVDALTLTATPIPRTLHFSLMGARDLSIISTPPPNRRPVTTEIHEFNEEVIRDAVSHELRRNGQVFFVHNRIGDIENIANTIYKLVPDAKIGIAHGQMEGKQLEKVMLKFIDGDFDVLVSTNIIESGLDIPNANTIIINRANMFGLSDLHQMRGRVGRSNTKAYCYLLTPPQSVLTSDARKRLITLEEFSDLGDGFKVAMRDLDIRGAGNLLGSEQSGFINDMGFDMYHKILDEAVAELKETEFKELFEGEMLDENKLKQLVNECVIETDLEILIPQDYVNSTAERLQLYSQLDEIESEEELASFVKKMEDRFGRMPESVGELVKSVRMRWVGLQLGIDKITVKNEKMKCYISNEKDDSYFQSQVFGQILGYAQANPRRTKIQENKNRLIITTNEVISINDAIEVLKNMAASA